MPHTSFSTAFGQCSIAWKDKGLTGFFLPKSTPVLPAEPVEPNPPAWIQAIVDRVQRHLTGDLQDFADLGYDFSGQPAFAQGVFRATLAVKAGQTATYGDIAAAIGQPAAASRAVGAALGANPWPLLIPCHRIVAADGKMTGYSGPGGVVTKARLLALEGAQLL